MKMKLAVATIGLALTTTMPAFADTGLSSDSDKLSYSIGADLGRNFKKQGIEVKPEILAQGMQDSMSGSLKLTDEQMKTVIKNFQKDLIARKTTKMNKQASTNKSKGEAFLSQNKNNDGVVVLPSGLQYKILEAGNGAKPSKSDTVTVDYTGRLIDGKVFDSTSKTGKPATFQVSQVIPGWTEALQLMPSGSTWEIYIPAKLAYGPRNMGSMIGPNETLIFKIHLISVKKS